MKRKFIFALTLGLVLSSYINAALTEEAFSPDEEEEEFEETLEEPITEEIVTENFGTMRELGKKYNKKKHNKDVPVAAPIPIQQTVIPVQVVASSYQEVEEKLSCPPGYDLRDSNCVSNEIIQPDMQCPPGNQFQDGRCLSYTRGQMSCPPEYRLSGGRCALVEIVPVQYTCPDGVLDETGQGCRIIEPSEARCPSGYRMEQDVCVQRFPAPLLCDDGYVADKHHGCKKYVEYEAQMMCPAGSEMDALGTTCLKLHHQGAKCPKNYKLDKQTGKCMKKVKKVLSPCHQGFTPVDGHGNLCERKVESPPELSCPVDSKLDPLNGQCVNELQTGYSCPEGFMKSVSTLNSCEKIVEEVGSCPPGTTPVGYGSSLRCQRVIEHDITQCCPPGYDQVFDKCERREYIAPMKSCDDCVRVRKIPILYTCPEGSNLQGRMCIHSRSEPCSTYEAPSAVNCAVYQRLLSSVSLRSLSAVDPATFVPAECLRPVHAPKLCTKEEKTPAAISCPSGTEYDGENCLERIETPNELRCAAGTLDEATGQCLRITTVQAKTECEPGTTRIGDRCVEYEEHLPDFSCPPESIMDKSTGSCVIRTASIPSEPEIFRSAPISLCSSGTLSGSMCWDIERVPRTYICPEGSTPESNKHGQGGKDDEDSHYCIKYASLIVPPPTKKHVKPLYYCPDSNDPSGKKCHSYEYSSMSAVCPSGSVLSDDSKRCVRQMKPIKGHSRVSTTVAIPVCPTGTVVQGTKCVSTKQVNPHIICPPGFARSGVTGNNRECSQEVNMINVCPPGTTHTMDGCLRMRTVSPIVRRVPIQDCKALNTCY